MERPYLLVDVDGVLSPFGSGEMPAGFSRYQLVGDEVWLSRRHGEWLGELGAWFELVWATAWEGDAAELVAPLLGLPEMPVIELSHDWEAQTWKLRDVDAFVGDRPLAWIDDDLNDDAYRWADQRPTPTLLVRTVASEGITEEHFRLIRDFGIALALT